ncbi:MAG: hypothetical protein RCO49_09725 [Rickettsia endosymbiont of Argas persicus]
MSKTDKFADLDGRITPVIKSFSDEMQGVGKILDISEILGKK